MRSRDGGRTPDITLQGLSARGPGGLRLQQYFRDGAYAEQIRVPTENAIPIGAIDPADAGRWCALNTLLVPYSGLLAADLRAGETVLVSGATGNFGSSAVLVALAMGAGCVVAPGRNAAVLAELVRRFGARVRPVHLTGDETTDRKRMRDAGPGAIDCVLDILPPSVGTPTVRGAVMAVRQGGRAVLMGGIGMLGGADLGLPYPWIMRNNITVRGQWMYESDVVVRMIALIRSGLVDLGQFDVRAFDLADVQDAVAHAAADAGPFKLTVVRP